MLLDRLRIPMLGFAFHPGVDMDRLNITKADNPILMEPNKELAHSAGIGFADIPDMDLGGKEFEEAPRGVRSDFFRQWLGPRTTPGLVVGFFLLI